MFLSMAATEIPVNIDYWNITYWLADKLGLQDGALGALFVVAALLCIVLPYLMGSINPAILISRFVYHDDIRTHGSGNAGTTNMLRTFGTKAAVCTLLCDFGKAILATLLGRLLFGEMGQSLAGFFVGFGHMFPIFYRFKGGKGVACFAMVGLVIHPLVFVGLLTVFLIVLIGTKFVSLASVMAAFMFPFLMEAFAGDQSLTVAMAVLATCFVVFMHRENLKRIWNHEESKIDFSKFKKKKKEPAATSEEESDDE